MLIRTVAMIWNVEYGNVDGGRRKSKSIRRMVRIIEYLPFSFFLFKLYNTIFHYTVLTSDKKVIQQMLPRK